MAKKNQFFKLDMLLLYIIAKQDCYGYEITKQIKTYSHELIDSELPRLTLRLEVRASCFNHHCLAGNLTVLSGLHDVYKRYIRLIPSLYVLY